MRSYMKKPYTFHLEKHSSEVLQNVTFDVNKLYDLILYGMELVSDLLIIGMLSVYLLLQDALITIATAVLLEAVLLPASALWESGPERMGGRTSFTTAECFRRSARRLEASKRSSF